LRSATSSGSRASKDDAGWAVTTTIPYGAPHISDGTSTCGCARAHARAAYGVGAHPPATAGGRGRLGCGGCGGARDRKVGIGHGVAVVVGGSGAPRASAKGTRGRCRRGRRRRCRRAARFVPLAAPHPISAPCLSHTASTVTRTMRNDYLRVHVYIFHSLSLGQGLSIHMVRRGTGGGRLGGAHRCRGAVPTQSGGSGCGSRWGRPWAVHR
jgi:hypothetical protein